MKIPGDSLSGIPLCFRWRLGINYFWRQLGSSLELSCWHFKINSFWFHMGSPSVFAIPVDSLSGITPCFTLLGFTLITRLCGTTYFPVGGLLYFSFLGVLHQHILIMCYCRLFLNLNNTDLLFLIFAAVSTLIIICSFFFNCAFTFIVSIIICVKNSYLSFF